MLVCLAPGGQPRGDGNGHARHLLLPTLCHLFDVTLDYLLGIDVEQKEAKIEEIAERAHGYSARGYY